MRTLEYTLTLDDGAMSVRHILKEKLLLSNKEISHAKNFEDGICAELDVKNKDTLRDRLHTSPANFSRDEDVQEDYEPFCKLSHEYVFTEKKVNNQDRNKGRNNDGESVKDKEKAKDKEGIKNKKKVKDKHSDGDIEEQKKVISDETKSGLFRVTVNETLYPGEKLTVTLHETPDGEGRIVPVQGEINILYEDDDIIVLNKPPGIVSHPSPGHRTDSLSNRLAYYFEQKNEPHRIRIIGRLDKDASGALLFAKTRMAARALKNTSGAYDKEYIALCMGVFPEDEKKGTVDLPILKRPEVILKREINPDGERAVTHYKVLEQGKAAALVRLKLETGRTHQIRVHMAALGNPLVGDLIYSDYSANEGIGIDDGRAKAEPGEGEFMFALRLTEDGLRYSHMKDDKYLIGEERSVERSLKYTRAMLHARSLNIIHPVTGQKLTFSALIPDDMKLAGEALGLRM